MKRITPILLIFLALVACDPNDSGSGSDPERGSAGKADLVGSCEEACGGQSASGMCWCDDLCADFGDCCSDRAAVCGDPDAAFCGGFGGLPCADGETCIDDPTDDCDPNAGGADCGGICVPDEDPTDTGDTEGPMDPQEPTFCGGFGNLPCPDGETCVDDPTDDCDPNDGGADCGGVCVADDAPFCGGFGNLPCPDGLTCVDDPTDDCDPVNANADCGGICV
jgi:hypothetical protein